MKKYGVALQVHYIPIYKQPYYKKKYKFNLKNIIISENFYLQEVSLPIFYSFKKKDQIKLISIIKKILKVK